MCRVEFLVALQVDVALVVVTDLEDVPDLRSDADDPRFEATDPVATAAVARDLVVEISDEAKLPFLGQELRDAPIEVHVDAILVVGVRIFEIVSEAERGRELMPCLRIEIAVGTADVDRPVTD